MNRLFQLTQNHFKISHLIIIIPLQLRFLMLLILLIQLIKQLWQRLQILLKSILSQTTEIIPQEIINLHQWFPYMATLIWKHFLEWECFPIDIYCLSCKKRRSEDKLTIFLVFRLFHLDWLTEFVQEFQKRVPVESTEITCRLEYLGCFFVDNSIELSPFLLGFALEVYPSFLELFWG